MGSGETSPTMVRTHRENIARLANKKPLCVILDTPFGFQPNADDIAHKAMEYFRVSIGVESEIASFRSSEIDNLETERFFSKLSTADFVFAGPGSPTYALRHWKNTQFPKILANKLSRGTGIITFSSAAALTLGSHTIPVYEIYKVGDEPDWIPGLDILSTFGIKGAVIPHYNNTEGGNHDTRFCYLGEERLDLMESKLQSDEFIFGIDEHTAVIIDLNTKLVEVSGNGTFNMRNQGRQVTFESGSKFPLGSLIDTGTLFKNSRIHRSPVDCQDTRDLVRTPQSQVHEGVSPLIVSVDGLLFLFDQAIGQKDMDAATKAVLSLLNEIAQWQTETFQSDEMDQARFALRSMIVRLGELAAKGSSEPEDVYGPFVNLALELRTKARQQQRWAESDQIRDGLAVLGVEVRDNPDGSEWISIGKK